MPKLAVEILQSARVAELRMGAEEISALCKRPAVVHLPSSPSADRRRLLLLLAHERRRNARLVEILANG